jgi:hypothetical protein
VNRMNSTSDSGLIIYGRTLYLFDRVGVPKKGEYYVHEDLTPTIVKRHPNRTVVRARIDHKVTKQVILRDPLTVRSIDDLCNHLSAKESRDGKVKKIQVAHNK